MERPEDVNGRATLQLVLVLVLVLMLMLMLMMGRELVVALLPVLCSSFCHSFVPVAPAEQEVEGEIGVRLSADLLCAACLYRQDAGVVCKFSP